MKVVGDFVTRLKLEEFFGREPNYTGRDRAIYHLKAPLLPQYRFEWHPQKRNVYLIRVGSEREVGEVLAFNVETHGDAHNAVLIWIRGFREGQVPELKPHLAE